MNKSSVPDEELLAQFLVSQDGGAIEELISRHANAVFGLCYRILGHRQDAEDAFQATFLVLARDAKRIRRPQALAGWLYGVAYRIATRASAQQHSHREIELKDTVGETKAPLAQIAQQWEQAMIDEEVYNLPNAYREVIVLRYLEGRSTKETAELLRLSTGAVKGRVERAKRLLRQRLLSRGVFIGALGCALTAGQSAIAAVGSGLVERTAAACIAPKAAVLACLVTSNASELATRAGGMSAASSLKVCIATMASAILVLTLVAHLDHHTLAQEASIHFNRIATDAQLDEGSPFQLAQFVVDAHPGAVPEAQDGGHITSVDFSPAGNYLAGSCFDNTVKIWTTEAGELRSTLKGHTACVRTVAYSPDGEQLASGGDDRTVRIWSAKDGKPVRILPNHPGDVLAIAFAKNGDTLVSVGWDKRGSGDENQKGFVRFSNVRTGANSAQFELQAPSLAVAATNRFVAVGDSLGTVHMYEATTGKRLRSWKAHPSGVLAISTSRTGSLLATGSFDRTVVVWNIETAELVQRFDGHVGEVRSIAFSPDGKSLVSGSDAGYLPGAERGTKKLMSQIRVWDLSSGNLVQNLNGTYGQTWSLDFSKEGFLARCDSGGVELLSADAMNIIWSAHYE